MTTVFASAMSLFVGAARGRQTNRRATGIVSGRADWSLTTLCSIYGQIIRAHQSDADRKLE